MNDILAKLKGLSLPPQIAQTQTQTQTPVPAQIQAPPSEPQTLEELSIKSPAGLISVPQPSGALTQHDRIVSQINELQEALLAKHPQMPQLLRVIHAQLKEDPAVVTLLEEDQIRIIVQGLESQTNTFLAQSMTKTGASAKTKALKNVKSEDLGFD